MGKDLTSYTILEQLLCEDVTLLLCKMKEGIFQSLSEGRVTKSLQRRATTPSSSPAIPGEGTAESEATTFSSSLTWKNGLHSQDVVVALSCAICLAPVTQC